MSDEKIHFSSHKQITIQVHLNDLEAIVLKNLLMLLKFKSILYTLYYEIQNKKFCLYNRQKYRSSGSVHTGLHFTTER